MTDERKIACIMEMDKIIREMNDEEAIYWWLEEGVPDHMDELTYDDIDIFLEEAEYIELVALFTRINDAYPEEGILDKLLTWGKEGKMI